MHRFLAATVVILVILIIWLVSTQTVGVRVYRFYSDNCKYCVQSKGEWKKFKNRVMFKYIQAVDVNVDDPSNAELLNSFGVKSWPSIIVLSDGHKVQIENCSAATADDILVTTEFAKKYAVEKPTLPV
jgi:thioredoxin-like negative regulator of GroEL